MSAAAIARAFGGHQTRGGWWQVKCPICQTDRLGLKDGNRGLVVNCYRNSGASGCSRADILAALRQLGLYGGPDADKPVEPDPDELARRAAADEADRQQRIAKARWIWQKETYPATDTAAHTYLHSRGLYFKTVPEAIRFHPSLYHTESREYRPAMVCKINHVVLGDIGIECTYIAIDGSQKATLTPVRRTFGAKAGGAVHLGEPTLGRWLVVGEGVETVLSVAQLIGCPAWPTLSKDSIKSLVLPRWAGMVMIAADNDQNGAGQRAAEWAACRWMAEGRRVKVVMPPVAGVDWNAALLAGSLTGRRPYAA
jgi:putative DNA primase/helicase